LGRKKREERGEKNQGNKKEGEGERELHLEDTPFFASIYIRNCVVIY